MLLRVTSEIGYYLLPNFDGKIEFTSQKMLNQKEVHS